MVKRRHGFNRCRYKGYVGMNRWVGLGVIADNVVNIGRALERQGLITQYEVLKGNPSDV